MEGLKVYDANLMVYLHPSKSNKVSDAILQELSSLLFKFNETFDGVVLAYDVKVPEKYAMILHGIDPYFGVKLNTMFLLFSPKPNMLIEGKVVKLTKESIHVIILGFASATILREDIRKEFKYKVKHGRVKFESRSHKQHVVKAGTIIRFLVKSMDEENLHISGSLIPNHTGSIKWLLKNSRTISLTNRSSRKRGSESELDIQECNVLSEGLASSDNVHQIKKSKKHPVVDS